MVLSGHYRRQRHHRPHNLPTQPYPATGLAEFADGPDDPDDGVDEVGHALLHPFDVAALLFGFALLVVGGDEVDRVKIQLKFVAKNLAGLAWVAGATSVISVLPKTKFARYLKPEKKR